MDYTTLSEVKLALGSLESTDDVLLSSLITQASRFIDRYCAGFVDSDDYFAHQSVIDEVNIGYINANGVLRCFLRKPIVTSVTAFRYKRFPHDTWQDVDPDMIHVQDYVMSVSGFKYGGKVQVMVSYSGGFNPLPGDIVNAATLLAVRFYREVKSGLGDSIGIAELGTLTYTKAIPARVVEMLRPYRRVVL